MANNTLDLGKVTLVEGEDLSVLEHLTYNLQKQEVNSDKSLVETMTGYSGSVSAKANLTNDVIYAGVVKNGNKITFVYFSKLVRTASIDGFVLLFNFSIPSEIGAKLYPFSISGSGTLLDYKQVGLIKKSDASFLNVKAQVYKSSNTQINIMVANNVLNALDVNEEYLMRYEVTFLLSDNLVS